MPLLLRAIRCLRLLWRNEFPAMCSLVSIAGAAVRTESWMTLVSCLSCGQSCDDIPVRKGLCVTCWYKTWKPQTPDAKVAPPPSQANVNEWAKAGMEGKP
mgnify:CR=1 FL=1